MTTSFVRNYARLGSIGIVAFGLVTTAFGCSSDDPASGDTAGASGSAGAGASAAGASASAGTTSASGAGGASASGAGAGGTSGAGTAGAGTAGASTAGAGGTAGAATAGAGGSAGGTGGAGGGGGAAPFELTSTAFAEGAEIPAEYTCVSSNGSIESRPSPPLAWGPGPVGTAGYAIVLRDQDGNFTHWALWDIPPSALGLPRDVSQASHTPPVPAGSKQVGGNNESLGYIRPCPPNGSRTYRFTLYAQKTLPLAGVNTNQDANTVKTELDKAANNAGTTTLEAKCTR